MEFGRSLGVLFVGLTYMFYGVAYAQTTNEKLASIASKLFNIPLNQINSSTGANYNYNGYAVSPEGGCIGYDGGHSGIDIQTKDVAGNATEDRRFFALLGGTVISNPLIQTANAINIYNQVLDVTVTYLHAREIFVAQNESISVGDTLGIQGNVGLGYSNTNSAEHVHIEVRSGSRAGAACGASTTLNPIDYLYTENPTSCFSVFGAGVNAISTTFEDLTVGFTAKNNCGSLRVLQNIAISFHDNNSPDEFIQTCYKPNPELNENIGAGNTRTFSKKACNVDKGNLEAGQYRLRYKVKYKINNDDVDGTWFHNVAERGIEILPSLSSAPESDILEFMPAILAGTRKVEPLCSLEELSGSWYRLGEVGSSPPYTVEPVLFYERNVNGTGTGLPNQRIQAALTAHPDDYLIIHSTRVKGDEYSHSATYYSGFGFESFRTKTGAFINGRCDELNIDEGMFRLDRPTIALEKVWQKSDDGVRRSYTGAANYCANLSIEGNQDWSLPTRLDLKKLVKCMTNTGGLLRNHQSLSTGESCSTVLQANEDHIRPTIYPELFDAHSNRYWTDSRTSASSAFFVDFSDGLSAVASTNNEYYVRCVRDR